MEEVIIVAIWDKGEDVLTRPIVVNKNTKELKFKGKKPNKIIIPESLKDVKLLRKIDKIKSYDCLIVKAIGK